MSWTLRDLADQRGRQALITGTTVGGLGHHTALELARAGARVVLTGRDPDRLAATRDAILAEVPDAELHTLILDLASLASVREAAERAAEFGALDVLINNAGVMAPPGRRRTPDGFDLQWGTNHLGPFLLTGLLLPQLARSEAGRVVTVSSLMHTRARRAPVGDPREPADGSPWARYADSKLANLMFTYELERRLRATGSSVTALAAHPGFARTRLISNGPASVVLEGAARVLGQPAPQGAWPLLMAATATLPGGTFCGPSGFAGLRGAATTVRSSALSHDRQAQRRLWEVSEEATGLDYP